MKHTDGKLSKGCVVFMKRSSGMTGWGNAQCVQEVHHESLGTISLYAHNQHYKIYDIDRIVECPVDHNSHDALLAALKKYGEHETDCAIISPRITDTLGPGCTCGLDEAITQAEKEME